MARERLDSLRKKVDPKHAAVLVVDVQNDFAAEGGMMDREGSDISMAQAIIPRLQQLIDEAHEAGVGVIFIRNVYNTDPNWYLSDAWLEQAARTRKEGSYLVHSVCGPGSWAGDFYKVRPTEKDVVVTKHRFSAFPDTDLDLVLRSRGIRTLIMTGLATNGCVESTARDGFFRDYYIVFTSDCTATYSQEDHESTLRNMHRYFGEVVTADEVAACWKQAPVQVGVS
ncbi:MAG: cysteine hydrolase [Candidatus Tectomicrobia bacterium]|nr:cysteine hydrolase [Candidatus Tectomicrobia bacterium]